MTKNIKLYSVVLAHINLQWVFTIPTSLLFQPILISCYNLLDLLSHIKLYLNYHCNFAGVFPRKKAKLDL